MTRLAALQDVLDAAEPVLRRVTGPGQAVAAEVVRRWSVSPGQDTGDRPKPQPLPVCEWLAPALALSPTALGDAFAGLLPELVWQRRTSADPADRRFWNGHANTILLGPQGLEPRDDLLIGATVMAPDVLYPDHNHPPAEVYLPLSAGEWWNAEMDWTDPGLSGFIYNPPGILHAMRSGKAPFLALWFLPI